MARARSTSNHRMARQTTQPSSAEQRPGRTRHAVHANDQYRGAPALRMASDALLGERQPASAAAARIRCLRSAAATAASPLAARKSEQ